MDLLTVEVGNVIMNTREIVANIWSFSSYLFGFVATLMLGILLTRGLCGFAGNITDPEGNTDTGLAVALSRYLGLVGELKGDQVYSGMN